MRFPAIGGRSLSLLAILWLLLRPAYSQDVEILSTGVDGGAGDGASTQVRISGDGLSATFTSSAPLLTLDQDSIQDIYLFDPASKGLRIVSSDAGEKGDGDSQNPSIDFVGYNIVFSSDAHNLGVSNHNQMRDVFLWRVDPAGAPALFLLSQVSGSQDAASGESDHPVISANAKAVVFQSSAPDLASPAPPANRTLIYWRDLNDDLEVGTARLISPPSGEVANNSCLLPDVSGNGRKVVFHSRATNLGPGSTNEHLDVYLVDVKSETVDCISCRPKQEKGSGDSANALISSNGRYVAFDSHATNLVPGDTNKLNDVFRFDVLTSKTKRVSLRTNGQQGEGSLQGDYIRLNDISANGRFVAFETSLPFVPADKNQKADIYVRDCLRQQTILVTLNDVSDSINGNSFNGSLSDDATVLGFESPATNVVTLLDIPDNNRQFDAFRRSALPIVAIPDLPPANHVRFVSESGELQVVDLDGAALPSGIALDPLDPVVAVDDLNQIWAHLPGGNIQRFDAFERLPLGNPIPLPAGDRPIELCAAGGFAWVLRETDVLRLTPEGIDARLPIPRLPLRLTMAIDRAGNVWVGGDYLEADANVIVFRLSKLTRDLQRIRTRTYRTVGIEFVRQMEVDKFGQLFARTDEEIIKFSTAGAILWRQQVKGAGLAVDDAGNVYTVSSDDIIGLRPDATQFLSQPHSQSTEQTSEVVLDGLGRVWALIEGASELVRVDPNLPREQAERFPTDSPIGDQRNSKLTGFIAALVEKDSDSDGDQFLNGVELADGQNPFDSGDPAMGERVLPVISLTATAIDDNTVRLDWTSAERYERIFVFRDQVEIPGSPFDFDTAANGVLDENIQGGGVRTYTVVPQGRTSVPIVKGARQQVNIEVSEPFGPEEETLTVLGQGLLGTCVGVEDPTAVAFNPDTNEVVVARELGLLTTFDANNPANQSTVNLPANPFGSQEVRGMEFDPDNSQILYLLLEDGDVYRRFGANDPTFDIALGPSPSAAGYAGMTILDTDFVVLAGPDIECLISFNRVTGILTNDIQLSVVFDLFDEDDNSTLVHSRGVSLHTPDATLVTGIGTTGTLTISQVAKLDSQFMNASSAVPVNGFGSTSITDFTYASIDSGVLIIANYSGSSICFAQAEFPPSPSVTSITPNSGPWDAPLTGTRTIQIDGVNFGDNTNPFAINVLVDDAAVVGLNIVDDTTMTLELDEIGEVRSVQVDVQSLNGSATTAPEYIYGFLRSDSNNDHKTDVSDPIHTLLWLFGDSDSPDCADAVDANDDGVVNIADGLYTLNYLFSAGPDPLDPFSATASSWGLDPSFDDLDACVDE